MKKVRYHAGHYIVEAATTPDGGEVVLGERPILGGIKVYATWRCWGGVRYSDGRYFAGRDEAMADLENRAKEK